MNRAQRLLGQRVSARGHIDEKAGGTEESFTRRFPTFAPAPNLNAFSSSDVLGALATSLTSRPVLTGTGTGTAAEPAGPTDPTRPFRPFVALSRAEEAYSNAIDGKVCALPIL